MTLSGIEQTASTPATSSTLSVGRHVTPIRRSEEENNSGESRQSVGTPSQQDRVEISNAAQELSQSQSSSQQGNQEEAQSPFNKG